MSVPVVIDGGSTLNEDQRLTREEPQLQNGDQESAALRSTYKKFAENTSFPGVGLITKTRSPTRRFLWISFLILGTSMAIYQSLDLIKGYRNYQVLSILSEMQNKSVFFPSITFCPPLPVLWNKIYPNHTVYKQLQQFLFQRTNFSNWEDLTVDLRADNRRYVLSKLRQLVYDLDEVERNKVLPELEDVFLAVFNSSDTNMERYFISTYIPAYGRCFTFNPALPGFEKIDSSVLESIDFIVHLNPEHLPPILDDRHVLLNLHALGTAPELITGRIIKVRKGQELHAHIELAEYHRLSSPYPSNCTMETAKLVNLSLYSSNDRQYDYERRACKEKVAYNEVLQKLGCSDPFLPPQSSNLTLCSSLRLDLVDETLVCKVSCNSKVYEWFPVVTTQSYTDEDLEDLENFLKSYALTVAKSVFVPSEMKNDLIFMKFKMRSTVYDTFTEQPRYSFSDIVGAIGGNIGIWIGFSIVSLMEVFDFIVRVLMKFLNLIFCRQCQKKKEKISQENYEGGSN